MFDQPSAGAPYSPPAEPFDPYARYLFRLIRTVNQGKSTFRPEDGSEPRNRIRWEWHLALASNGSQIMNADGEPFVLFDWTSSATGRGKTEAKTATARKWMEALEGRTIDDDENMSAIAEQLPGKVAAGLLDERQREDGSTRLAIRQLMPSKRRAAAPAAPVAAAPARRPAAQAETADDLEDVAF